jgi:RimJ/RimL family protein N-acetyltransferase
MTEVDGLLRGRLVYLAAQDADSEAETVASWSHDSEFLRLLSDSPARPRTTQYWKHSLSDGADNPTGFPFGIHALDDGRLIGFVALWITSWPSAEAAVAIGLGKAADRGRGYGTDAMRVALRYGFAELNLERVTLGAFSHNARGIRAYEKAGFVREGQEREWLRRDGERYGQVSMGILRADWLRAEAAARDL